MAGVKFDFTSLCTHCHQDFLSHTTASPFWCIAPDLRRMLATCFTPEPKMLSYYQLNDFNRDVIVLVESARLIKLLKSGETEGLSTATVDMYNDFCEEETRGNSKKKKKKKKKHQESDEMLLFKLVWSIRAEAEYIARKQSYADTYPFQDQAQKLGLLSGVVDAS